MARRPYFSGNYGSALGSTANAANLIARAGEVQGNMYANMGQQIGGMIKQYGLNKEKRNKLQATLEGQLSADPSIVQQLTMTGDEQYDKKNMKLFDKVQSGDASIADLERANGLLSGKTTQENAMLKKQNAETQQRMNELNLEVGRLLKDPKVRTAVAEASTAESNSVTAEAKASYAGSIASADYSKKIADERLTRAQTEYYEAKSKAEEKTDSYKPGQRVDIEGASGNKVSFVYTGNSLQPLNDTVSQKFIDEAVVRGVDNAELQVYLEDNYDYDKKSQTYTFKKDNSFGFGGGTKNPMMEQAITILGMRGQVKKEGTEVSKGLSPDPKPTINEHKSANEKAKSGGKMFYILNGEKYKVQ